MQEISRADLAIHPAVATVSILGLVPVILVVGHLRSLGIPFGIRQGMLEATLSALADAEEAQSDNYQGTDTRRGGVHADVCRLGQIVPLLG